MFHLGRLFRLERIEHGLLVAGRMQAAFHPQLFDQALQAESARHHTDGTDDGGRIRIDFIGGAGQPVAARRGDVFGEGDDRDLLFVGQLPDAAGDQGRLHG